MIFQQRFVVWVSDLRYFSNDSEMEVSSPIFSKTLQALPLRNYCFRITTSTRASSQRIRFKPPCCNKMFVPGFGEASPEAKAASNLHDFFTFVAVKIVLAQLESYNPEAYEELMEFVSRNSLNDGDKFCANLMRESSRHKRLALRILEVRSVYSKLDFEWDNLKRLSLTMVDESNTRLMRDYVRETSHLEN